MTKDDERRVGLERLLKEREEIWELYRRLRVKKLRVELASSSELYKYDEAMKSLSQGLDRLDEEIGQKEELLHALAVARGGAEDE